MRDTLVSASTAFSCASTATGDSVVSKGQFVGLHTFNIIVVVIVVSLTH